MVNPESLGVSLSTKFRCVLQKCEHNEQKSLLAEHGVKMELEKILAGPPFQIVSGCWVVECCYIWICLFSFDKRQNFGFWSIQIKSSSIPRWSWRKKFLCTSHEEKQREHGSSCFFLGLFSQTVRLFEPEAIIRGERGNKSFHLSLHFEWQEFAPEKQRGNQKKRAWFWVLSPVAFVLRRENGVNPIENEQRTVCPESHPWKKEEMFWPFYFLTVSVSSPCRFDLFLPILSPNKKKFFGLSVQWPCITKKWFHVETCFRRSQTLWVKFHNNLCLRHFTWKCMGPKKYLGAK